MAGNVILYRVSKKSGLKCNHLQGLGKELTGNVIFKGCIKMSSTCFSILGGAVITNPPLNQNKTEGDIVSFVCEGEGTPGNLSVSW